MGDVDRAYIPREKWANKIEFVLSGIGFAVGLGNIWRFPYLCYKNGGGAFLIPYVVCLIAGGIPIFFLEVGLGQYTSEGGITVWNIVPLFKGIGIGTTIICFILNVYYIIILAWAAHYFYNSLTFELPWSSCDNEWNTENCFGNSSIRNDNRSWVDPVVEYWENKVLGISPGIEHVGSLQVELAISLLVVWILVYFCVWNGIKSSGKVVYFTAVFPYFMLTALLIRGVTLDGAVEGIKFYLQPDFSKLSESQVWIDAGTQIFFSYAIALGCMTALGSYNKFNNDFIKDCLFISVVNSSTSIYSGLAVFSVLGFMAKEQNVSIEDVAESGPGLVFITYPKAVGQMPAAPLWSALFFFMILLMGLDSQFVGVEGFITAVVDLFPQYLRDSSNRKIFIAAVSFVSFLIGLLMVTNGGIYVFQLFDYYGASGMVLLWFCFFECIAVAYFYGMDKFYANVKEMVGYKLHIWFKICWKWLTPIVTMGILIFSTVQSLPLTYNRKYIYPAWAINIGRAMALIPMIIIPLYFVLYFMTRSGTLKEKWNKSMNSSVKTESKQTTNLKLIA
ncbi:sodium- and chloride-dependent taurine transporter-like [Cimex lectularius]|uniref:Transporter n=1 Tax=Cimex lectularius TaxID=79782 RepID=A0A8I6TEZ1_CIMLE|nr:sodium- and chloride-dependent taurine transporter-like [Cimex lectularius]